MLTNVDKQAEKEATQRDLVENKIQNNEVFVVTK
jgi:hypothetical protein